MSKANKTKTFVLDTNVLLHDPDSIFKFEDNAVVLPVEVLSELDRKKTSPGSVGANARAVNRHLRALFDNLPKEEESRKQYDMSADLPNGGKLHIVINQHLLEKDADRTARLKATLPNLNEPDHRILASALYVSDKFSPPVILVTKDSNMAVKGMALGLLVEDYKNDQVEEPQSDDIPVIAADAEDIEMLLEAKGADNFEARVTINTPETADLDLNEYVLLEADGIREPARYVGDGVFVSLPIYRAYCSKEPGAPKGVKMPRGNYARPRNWEQWVFMDALLNPDIQLVTAKGKAGTGKTYIAIASALSQVLSENSHFERLYISRPVVQIGKDIGALPGDKDEKLAPYIQPYFDNLEALFGKRKSEAGEPGSGEQPRPSNRKKKKPQGKVFQGKEQGKEQSQAPQKPYQWLLNAGLVEIEALGFIRGRSIADSFMVVDEAQNLTPHEAKTIVTRMAEGSKLVLIGDPAQIDSPFLDSKSNGLVHVRERMRNLPIAAHVALTEGVRSPLSEMAADLL